MTGTHSPVETTKACTREGLPCPTPHYQERWFPFHRLARACDTNKTRTFLHGDLLVRRGHSFYRCLMFFGSKG